ncbi:MAG: NUDIX hydrolase [Clostridia bacterium]|nr:NUDIX hydrolase [Clostridia bacterium]
MAEIWDLVDKNRQPTNLTHKRGEPVPDGYFHIVIHCWIMNKQGKILLAQRQVGCTDQLLWERTGGSLLTGETSLQGAIREVKEELGIDVSNCPNHFVKSQMRPQYHDIFDSWLFVVDGEVQPILQEEEVRQTAWLTLEEVCQMDKNSQIVNSSRYYHEVYNLFQSIYKK